MSLKTRDDWPIKEINKDPFVAWTHFDKQTNLWVPNQNGRADHFAPGLVPFGVGNQFKLMRNRRTIFSNNER
jgi:hypothetical protein